MRGKKTPKIDEALSRYKARASANKSPAKNPQPGNRTTDCSRRPRRPSKTRPGAEGKGKKPGDKTDHKSESSARPFAKAKDGEKTSTRPGGEGGEGDFAGGRPR